MGGFVFFHKGAPAPVKLWGALAFLKKFCSCGGELQDTLIEQSYVGPYWISSCTCVIRKEAKWWRMTIVSRLQLRPFLVFTGKLDGHTHTHIYNW